MDGCALSPMKGAQSGSVSGRKPSTARNRVCEQTRREERPQHTYCAVGRQVDDCAVPVLYLILSFEWIWRFEGFRSGLNR
jgi:hypothetical protein